MIGVPQTVIALVAFQRLAELIVSRRNTAALKNAGAIETGQRHYPLFVGLHGAWLIAIAFSVPPESPIHWPLLLAYAGLQPIRFWIMATLGRNWTTRILVQPGGQRVHHGPYRWCQHPNYAVVALEIPLLPLAFGAWPLAVIFGGMNAALLTYRIQVEDKAINAHLKR